MTLVFQKKMTVDEIEYTLYKDQVSNQMIISIKAKDGSYSFVPVEYIAGLIKSCVFLLGGV